MVFMNFRSRKRARENENLRFSLLLIVMTSVDNDQASLDNSQARKTHTCISKSKGLKTANHPPVAKLDLQICRKF